MLKVKKNMPNITCSHKTLNLDNSSKKQNSNFSEIRTLSWTSFLVIPLTLLYEEYIDRPKKSERKTHLSI